MVDASAVEYAKKSLSEGYSEDEIQVALKDAGWGDADAAEALRQVKSPAKTASAGASGKSPLEGVKAFFASIAERVKKLSWIGLLGAAFLVVGVLLLIWALATGCYHCIIIR